MKVFSYVIPESVFRSGISLSNVMLGAATEQTAGHLLCNLLGYAVLPEQKTAADTAALKSYLENIDADIDGVRIKFEDRPKSEQDWLSLVQVSVPVWPTNRSGTKDNPLFDVLLDNTDDNEVTMVDISNLRIQDRIDDKSNITGFAYRPSKVIEVTSVKADDITKFRNEAMSTSQQRKGEHDLRMTFGSPASAVATATAVPAAPPAPSSLIPAAGIDLAAYKAAGWTDQQLIDAGHATLAVATPPPPPTAGIPAPPPTGGAVAAVSRRRAK